MSLTTHTPRPPSHDQPVDRAPRHITVIVGMVSAVVLILAILSLFLFRSLAGREPSHVAVIEGNEKWLGAELTVTGPSLPRPYRAVIDESGRYTVPFFLPPGQYELIVHVDAVEIHREPFELREEKKLDIALSREGPTTRADQR